MSSILSWEELKKTINSRQLAALSVLKASPSGLTGQELNRQLGNTSGHKRLSELRNKRLVRQGGRRTCSVTGRRVAVWVLGEPDEAATTLRRRTDDAVDDRSGDAVRRRDLLESAKVQTQSAKAALAGGHQSQQVVWAAGHLTAALSTIEKLEVLDMSTRIRIGPAELLKENARLLATVNRLRGQLQLDLGV